MLVHSLLANPIYSVYGVSTRGVVVLSLVPPTHWCRQEGLVSIGIAALGSISTQWSCVHVVFSTYSALWGMFLVEGPCLSFQVDLMSEAEPLHRVL